MKFIRSISLVLLCFAFVPLMALGQTPEIDALKEMAEKGDVIAQFDLGFMYSNGEGVPKNYAEAVKWFRKAAEQGDASAQYNLGVMYDKGFGVPENDAEAVKWYRKAAEQGDDFAQFNLGLRYQRGEGVPENDAEAVKWYRKAAEQGNASAQLNLGYMYFKGDGVSENYVEAYKWLNLAAAQGNQMSKSNKNILARKMTTQQIAEAQRLSAAFKPRKEIPNKADTGSTKRPGATSSQPDSFGSGFFVTSNGYFLTNQHVVNGARDYLRKLLKLIQPMILRY